MKQLLDFFSMGGYAFYVWSAYGLTLMVLALNIFPSLRAERRSLRRLSRRREVRP